jgi:uncharacterized protein (TIGR02270 family)
MPPAPLIESVVAQHAEEAAFLWLLRDAAVRAPHYKLRDLATLDNRVEAHIDGLRVAGEAGWAICAAGLAHEEPGEVFAAGVLALEGGGSERFEEVYAVVEAVPETVRGLVSAFGWVAPEAWGPLAECLRRSPDPRRRALGIAAARTRRSDLAEALAQALAGDDPLVAVQALRAAGELRRLDLMPAVRRWLDVDDEASRFWAAWSGALLGDRSLVTRLKAFVNFQTPFRERALQLALRMMDWGDALTWLKALSVESAHLRCVLQGAGIVGDPGYVPSLMRHMEDPAHARVAGEAFSLITGADLAYEDLEGERPQGFQAGPTESPEDEDVAMDPDENLPWPDPARVRAWWEAHQGRFQRGTRYLVGKPIDEARCREVLLSGFQRQRIAAALELSRLRPEEPLFDWCAPGFRQQGASGRSGPGLRR